jgi:hypothetical protein
MRKRTTSIDVLPTIFAATTITGIALTKVHYGLGLLVIFGSGLASGITGIVSVALGKQRGTFSLIHILNMLWVLAVLGFLVWIIVQFYSLEFTF